MIYNVKTFIHIYIQYIVYDICFVIHDDMCILYVCAQVQSCPRLRRNTTTHQSHGVETPMKITMPKNNKKIL